MKIGTWARILLAATPLLAGCGDFWQAPSGSSGGSSSFTLTNSGNISVAAGTTGTSTITVTPGSSFTGTVSLACAVTTSISGATSPATCSLSPASVSISGTSAQTSSLTATSTSTTSVGAYSITVTGTSGSTSQTTTVCAQIGTTTASCSGSGSGSGTSGIFYILNQTTNQILAADIVSSKLNSIASTTVPSSTPLAIAVAPNNQFLYVSTASGIYLYTIGSGGALTIANGGVAVSNDQAYSMQVDATNSWLVEAVSGLAQLNAVAINSSTGTLATAGEAEQHVSLPSSTITQLAISPGDSSSCTNCYVFVGMGTGGTEIVLFNPANTDPFGATGTIKPKSSTGGDNAIAVDPTNRLLYVGESVALSATQSGGLRAFSIAASGVSEISGSPYSSAGTGPSAILPSADGNYVYVANRSVSGSSTGNIASFSVTATALTAGKTVNAGPSGALSLAEDSTSSYLLATDFAGNPDLTAYTMSSGVLTSALTTSTGTDPVGAIAIAAAP